MDQTKIRNIAIIAHVDHGKTTLVDHMLKQAHVFKDYEVEMQQSTILDSNELEREKGVTILAKNTAVDWNDYKINILDTPGHADFSGEVERVLNMADGCLLLVDAAEGVLSQTRYVLKLALELGLKPIVLINKIDRKDQRAAEVLQEINDLFLDLATQDSQLDFPVLYGIGRLGIFGFKTKEVDDHSLETIDSDNLKPLFDIVISHIPFPDGEVDKPFQIQVTSLDYDNYKGRHVIGRIKRGRVKKGQSLAIVRDNKKVGQSRVEYLFTYNGLKKEEITEACVGDIVAITGFADTKIADTLTDIDCLESLPSIHISEPTMRVQFSVSNSPFIGRDGKFSTSRHLKQRLEKELESNVSLRLSQGSTGESFIVSGRGELHISILIETMRREGFEFSVARPEVIYKQANGVISEPWEMLTIEVPEEYSGKVLSAMGERKGEMTDMVNLKSGVSFEYKISTRNLLGFRSEFLTQTSGKAIINSLFIGFHPKGENTDFNRNGVLIAGENGQATAYSIHNAQARGITFIEAGTEVYNGMIIGLNSRREDMVLNITKNKKLTNMRAASQDMMVHIAPSVKMSLEQCLTFLGADELLEVTPKHLRLCKRDLNKYKVRF
jgi:GTP-binding protein